MSLEIRREIAGFPGYEITSWGRVLHYGKEIKPQETEKGYLRVDLIHRGQRKHEKVHRLVAKHFIPNPEDKPQVNHIDGNKKNNSVTNLEWTTNKENYEHAKQIEEHQRNIEELFDFMRYGDAKRMILVVKDE